MKTLSKVSLLLATLFVVSCGTERGTEFQVTSPDGTLVVEVSTADNLSYKVTRHGAPVLGSSNIALHLADGRNIGQGTGEVSAKRETMHRTVDAPFHRQNTVTEHYNQLRLDLGEGAAVTFRVFNEGCAYRFETAFAEESVIINDETSEFNFAGDPAMWIPYTNGIANAFQFTYTATKQSEVDGTKPIILPLAVDCGDAGKVLIMESDMESYPGMFIEPKDGGLSGYFVELPDSVYRHERRHQEKVVTRHEYIAQTKGERTYPWRVLAVADEDKDLPTNDIVYMLAAENRIGDCSWVKTGKVAWDWWNDWGLDGVDFKPGINNETYKYYIDFASEYGLEYVVLDEGWYVPQSGDLLNIVDEINLEELIAYASEKNVKLILWATAYIVTPELCKHYADMGIAGFKVDFIDRDDQKAVDVVYALAEMTAAHKLVLDIHGVYKPTGLNRTYPNVINFEGVYGLEELKWSNPNMPEYDVTFPFIRMVQGPADYTPGAFQNATREGFKSDWYDPMSQGTRAHQVALYVVCDAPIVMLCDAPTRYEAEPECTRFIAQMPTDIDRTEILSGKMGEWIVSARQSGENWYVGGMTNWTPRQMEVEFSFLEEGKEYTAQILADAKDADINPTKHTITSQTVTSATKLYMDMAPGGGFAVILTPVK